MQNFQPVNKLSKSKRVPDPRPCRSADEAMFRSGVHVGHLSDEQARVNAGLQRLPLFAADSKTSNKSGNECTKHKFSAGSLGPGLMVVRFYQTFHIACESILRYICGCMPC